MENLSVALWLVLALGFMVLLSSWPDLLSYSHCVGYAAGTFGDGSAWVEEACGNL